VPQGHQEIFYVWGAAPEACLQAVNSRLMAAYWPQARVNDSPRSLQ